MSFHFSPKIIYDGLVLYLDAANPKSYPATSSIFFDLSKELNNGSIDNSPTYTSQYGGGFTFDGVNDAINIPYTSSLSPSVGVTLFSFFNISGFNSYYAPIIFKKNTFTSNYEEYEIGIYSGGNVRAIITGVDNSQKQVISGSNSFNKLTCAAATFDTVANEIKLYIDGTLVGTNVTFTSTFNSSTFGVNIGSVTFSSYPGYAIGTIYNSMIYNRVLSLEEINKNYESLRNRFL